MLCAPDCKFHEIDYTGLSNQLLTQYQLEQGVLCNTPTGVDD
jgi:hypothetical protein